MEKEILGQVYEIGYNFISSVGDEGSGEAFTKLRTIVENSGSEVISFELPTRISLAYPIERVTNHKRESYLEAYFGWIKFEAGKDKIDGIKKALDQDENLLRYIIIKTVRENTLAPKKILQQREGMKDRKSNPTSAPAAGEVREINEEEVDRQIDALVQSEEISS